MSTSHSKNQAIIDLLKAGWEQKRIASILNITQKTVSQRVRKNNLKEQVARELMQERNAEDDILELLNYQLRVMKLKTQEREEAYRASEDLKDLELIDKGEVDALYKMHYSIKSSQATWSNYVKISREIIDYLQGYDLPLSKELMDHLDRFLNYKRKEFGQ
jgi:transcriptional regulator with XRE-family HTH domain